MSGAQQSQDNNNTLRIENINFSPWVNFVIRMEASSLSLIPERNAEINYTVDQLVPSTFTNQFLPYFLQKHLSTIFCKSFYF